MNKVESGNPANLTNRGRGRPKGSQNKSSGMVRDAIAAFADGNAHKLQQWLDDVAAGVGGNRPDPGKAADLYLRAIEYHIPKLARTEHIGDSDKPIELKVSWAK